MADDRFFASVGAMPLADVAEAAGADLGPGSDPAYRVSTVAALADADGDALSFFHNPRYRDSLAKSAAGAVIVPPYLLDQVPSHMQVLISKTPYQAYARAARLLYPQRPASGRRHPQAVVAPSAVIGEGTTLDAGAVIGSYARIGARCHIHANAVIGDSVVLGTACTIGAHASVQTALLGDRVWLGAGVRIGEPGFGFDISGFPYEDVPQLGRVLIHNNVEIGANTAVDRGTVADTVIGEGCRLDNLVQIGHNVRLGRGCVVVAQCGIAGSTILEDFVILGGQAGVAGHLRLGEGCEVAAGAGVIRNVPSGQRVAGSPAMPVRDYFRLVAMWRRMLKWKG